jgi:uncharacterized protein (DUF2236 family)
MTLGLVDEEAHHGLFGPGSVTWRVHADPLMGLATLRALLLQVLHPVGQATVFGLSGRIDDSWGRVARTLRYIGVITFGTSAEAIMAAARLRALNAQVGGTRKNGKRFRGDDHDLVLWMHCCQVASFLDVVHRGGLALTSAQRDGYLREQIRTAVAWGLEPDVVPDCQRTLAGYFRRMRDDLSMTSHARIFVDAVIEPALPEPMMLAQRNRPAWAPAAGLAFASLPAWAQRFYGTRHVTGPAAFNSAATTVALHTVRDGLLERSVPPA